MFFLKLMPFSLWENPSAHCIGSLGAPQGKSRQVRKILPPNGIRSPKRSARSKSLYRLSYPGPLAIHYTTQISRRLESSTAESEIWVQDVGVSFIRRYVFSWSRNCLLLWNIYFNIFIFPEIIHHTRFQEITKSRQSFFFIGGRTYQMFYLTDVWHF